MNKQRRQIIDLLPILGILSFGGLYLYAATLYPGGSQNDVNSIGYDWVHNYWCNLLNEKSGNGMLNPARPIAILAMIILCMSLIQFFLQFSSTIARHKYWQKIIRITGIVSMIFAIFIFTDYHDLMTLLSSLFGLFAVIGIIVEIYKSELHFYKLTGVLCIGILGVNNIIYYTEWGIKFLPLFQKISFAVVLTWVGGLTMKMRRIVDFKE